MKTTDISSPNSRTFKKLLTLTKSRGIKKHRLALVSGPKQIREVARDFTDQCEGLIFPKDQDPTPMADIPHIHRYRLSPALFRQLDLFDTGHPLLIVRFPPFPQLLEDAWPSGCTLCIPFQDPANVGSVIRAAAGLAR